MSSNHKYFEQIDSLRAFAVIAVILYHLPNSIFKSGLLGVDIFFVISGFVVTASLQEIQKLSLNTALLTFYSRRIKRILPALYLMLTLSLILSTLFIPNAYLSNTIFETGLNALWGWSNWILNSVDTYFAPRSEFNTFTHTWSLGVEEQFYLIFPILYFFLFNLKSKTRILILCIIIFISLISSAVHPSSFYLLPFRAWQLLIGVLAFELYKDDRIKVPENSKYVWVSVLILAICTLQFAKSNTPWPDSIVPCLATAYLLIYFCQHQDYKSKTMNLLKSPVLNQIGKLSYSLYLWHWPVFILMRWTIGLNTILLQSVALLTTFLISYLSYNYIENPIRKLNTYSVKKMVFTIFIALLTTISLYLFFHWLNDHKSQISLAQSDKNPQVWSNIHYPSKAECPLLEEIVYTKNDRVKILKNSCTKVENLKRFFALGDSHMPAYEYIYSFAAIELNFEVHLIYNGGCPFVDLNKPMLTSKCKDFALSSIDYIKTNSKPDSMLFLASLRMPRLGDQWTFWGREKVKFFEPEKLKLREAAILESVQIFNEISELNLKIILEGPKPLFKNPPFRCHDWFNKSNPDCDHQSFVSKNEIQDYRVRIMQDLNLIKASSQAKILIWDIFEDLCPTDICSVFHDQKSMFFDGDHLTTYGNQVLLPSFIKLNNSIQNH